MLSALKGPHRGNDSGLARPLLQQRISSDAEVARIQPQKVSAQAGASAMRGNAASSALRADPKDGKAFEAFLKHVLRYDDSSAEMMIDAAVAPGDLYDDVCRGGAPQAMNAAAKAAYQAHRKRVTYAQLHRVQRPWYPADLFGARRLGPARDDEHRATIDALALAKCVPEHAAPASVARLLLASVFVSADEDDRAVWVDFRRFNEDMARDGNPLSPDQLQRMADDAGIKRCLQRYVDRAGAASGVGWERAYVLYPLDSK